MDGFTQEAHDAVKPEKNMDMFVYFVNFSVISLKVIFKTGPNPNPFYFV